MSLNKTISANGSRGHHRFTLSVTEDSTSSTSSFLSFTFSISPIVVGYDWYDWGSRIYYSLSIGGNTYTGTIPNYNGSSTVVLKRESNIEIEHEEDGTKTINLSFSVADSAGQSYTPGNASASGTFTLTDLHTPPLVNSVSILEQNVSLTALNLANDTIVQYLSKKKFTISATLYDEATLTNCSVYHNNVLIGTSSTNEVVVDFSNVGELQTTNSENTDYVGLMILVKDSMNGTTTRMINYQAIKYTKPVIENTSTTIKRKTGNGTVLTDNKANLNFVGTAYKANNLIGNNNTPVVEYKVWKTTEPVNYISVQCTILGNNVTVTNYEITNLTYTDVYNYKIRIRDSFGNSSEKTDKLPTGIDVWTEYKDRVNFLRATVGHKDVLTTDDLEISSNEKVVGKWIDGKPIYRKYVPMLVTSLDTNWVNAVDITGLNIDTLVNCTPYGIGNKAKLCRQGGAFYQIDNNYIQMVTWTSFGGFQNALLEYTKTTD